jgi:AraC family transcriptional regulator
MGGAFGQRFAEKFHLDDAPVIITRSLRQTEIAVTEIRSDNPAPGFSSGIEREDAYLVALQLRDYGRHEHYEDGKQVSLSGYSAGATCIYDLKRDPAFQINAPFHSMHFYLSRAALNALADDANAPRIGELDYRPGDSVDDATVRNIGGSLVSAFATPERLSRLFMDHVTLAVAAHVAQTYGGLQPAARPVQGGLAPWQEKRAKAMLAADLTGAVSLHEIARDCGLSVSHFSRAFRRSTGMAPHAWLLSRRVDAAKQMLRTGRGSLAEVAGACGFADQSHFTRVFSRHVGVSPGAWRRSMIR